MNDKNAAVLLAFACSCAALPLQAGRPAVTDDARVLDPKTCQLETWVRRSDDASAYYFMPACNPGFAELHVGAAWTHQGGEDHLTDVALQVKTLFKPWEDGGWGAGLSVGTDRLPRTAKAENWPGDFYFNVPVTLGNEGMWLHVNGGAIRRREIGKTIATWGVAGELAKVPHLTIIPETFGTDRGRPFYQLGAAYELVKDRVQVDASFGNRVGSGSAERYFTVGMKLQTPPFLP